MKFSLEIEMGNDAMCTTAHVIKALKEAAKRIRKAGELSESIGRLPLGITKIKDVNGNTVGTWSFSDE